MYMLDVTTHVLIQYTVVVRSTCTVELHYTFSSSSTSSTVVQVEINVPVPTNERKFNYLYMCATHVLRLPVLVTCMINRCTSYRYL